MKHLVSTLPMQCHRLSAEYLLAPLRNCYGRSHTSNNRGGRGRAENRLRIAPTHRQAPLTWPLRLLLRASPWERGSAAGPMFQSLNSCPPPPPPPPPPPAPPA